MKDMIKRMREEKGGFTIAELLIVVAIVGVLIAIAVPTFTAALEKAQHGTAVANARSYYGEIASAAIDKATVASTAFTADNIKAAYGPDAIPDKTTITVDLAGKKITVSGPGAGNDDSFTINPKVFTDGSTVTP